MHLSIVNVFSERLVIKKLLWSQNFGGGGASAPKPYGFRCLCADKRIPDDRDVTELSFWTIYPSKQAVRDAKCFFY